MIDQELIEKVSILDRIHKNIVTRLSDISCYDDCNQNKEKLEKVEKLIIKKYEAIISHL